MRRQFVIRSKHHHKQATVRAVVLEEGPDYVKIRITPAQDRRLRELFCGYHCYCQCGNDYERTPQAAPDGRQLILVFGEEGELK